MHTLFQDLRYAGRTFSREPGFTVLAILTIAVGVGADELDIADGADGADRADRWGLGRRGGRGLLRAQSRDERRWQHQHGGGQDRAAPGHSQGRDEGSFEKVPGDEPEDTDLRPLM